MYEEPHRRKKQTKQNNAHRKFACMKNPIGEKTKQNKNHIIWCKNGIIFLNFDRWKIIHREGLFFSTTVFYAQRNAVCINPVQRGERKSSQCRRWNFIPNSKSLTGDKIYRQYLWQSPFHDEMGFKDGAWGVSHAFVDSETLMHAFTGQILFGYAF